MAPDLKLLYPEAARRAAPDGEEHRSDTMGYYWPSVEYFADEYISNKVGFSSSYDDADVVRGWVHEALDEAADYLGDEGMLYLQALLDSLVEESNRLYDEYERKFGKDEVWTHDAEWDVVNQANIADACDMVREFLENKHG